jgi:hypothetical protein
MNLSTSVRNGLKICCIAAMLAATMVPGAFAQSKTYYMKYFSTGGSIYPWYSNDNSWGYHNTSGSGFMEMYTGQEYGWYSPQHTLPKAVWALGADSTWFWSNWSVNSGGRIDVCYDDFLQSTSTPNTSIQGWEIMIWAFYEGTQPLADHYNGNGQAVPYKTGIGVDGRTWNVYLYHNPDGYTTTTFIDQHQQSGESLQFRSFVDWCCNDGGPGFNYDSFLESVGCGWEYANGWASATSFGLGGF